MFSEGIDMLHQILAPHIPAAASSRGQPIPLKIQIMATLRYLGSASLQQTVADTLGMSQPSVSRSVNNVCRALVDLIADYIYWPDNINNEKNNFFAIAGFPGVVGIVDGSHIRILEPKHYPNAFINRKYYPSINICAICDSRSKFTAVSIRWPGSCHDSFVLRQMPLWDSFENNEREGTILGDSGYPCRTWLMTPFGHPQNQSEQGFNNALTKTRVKIECAFGRLKMRFRCLHDELRVTPEKAPLLIGAAMILHNIAIDLGMPHFDDIEDGNEEQPAIQHHANNGFEVRNFIANNYFACVIIYFNLCLIIVTF